MGSLSDGIANTIRYDVVVSLQDANKAVLASNFAAACARYWNHKQALGSDSPSLDFNFEVIRRRWLRSRRGQIAKVVVCSWELAHNPAGRAMTLAEAWQPHADVAIVGCIVPSFGASLWAPLESSSIPCHSFVVGKASRFVEDAFQLVSQHPAV